MDCYILRQLPPIPNSNTELILPDPISATATVRYLAKYGQRSPDTNGGDQLFSVRLPNRGYSSVSLSALIERTAGSGGTFSFCLDLGNDGVCDWSPIQQDFGGPVRLDTTSAAETELAAALKAYIQAQAGSAESLLVPIRVNIDTPADLFLFNLTATPGGDIDLQPLTLTVSPNDGSSPDNIPAGTPVTLSAMISNSGVYSAENFTVAFYNGNPAGEGLLIGATFIELLGPGASTTVTQTWHTGGFTGTTALYVETDAANVVPEADENNNLRSAQATVYEDLSGITSLTIDAGGPTDNAYDPVLGYGWLTEGETVASCGAAPEQTYRQISSVDTLDYRFDNLAPGRFYHLDLTFALCSGERQVNLLIDGQPVGESNLGLVDLGLTASTQITTGLQTVSILLDPASYADGTIDLSIARAGGLGGPLVNLIDLREIDYCFRDSGPGEPAWTAQNDCGYDPALPSDVYNGWGSAPEQTVRFTESGPINYRFSELDPAKSYNVGLSFYEGDNAGREQQLRFDGAFAQNVTLTSAAQQVIIAIPASSYVDGEVTLSIEAVSGTTIVSEVALEAITRRYPGTTPVGGPPPDPPPGSPLVEFASFLAYWSGSEINIEWSTTTEINNASFTLYRSTDTVTWLQIHTEPSSQACGNYTGTTPVNYAFADTSVTPGTTYYYQIQYSGEGCGGSNSTVAALVARADGDLEGQSITLPGGWQLISFRIDPAQPAPADVLSIINGRYDRVLGEDGIYSTELATPFNTLAAMNGGEGYYLRVTDPVGAGLLVEGNTVAASSPIPLHAGWNWIGYLPQTSLPPEVALQSLAGNVQRVLSLDQTYDPALPQFSTLRQMEPGQGYLLYANNPATLIYPTTAGINDANLHRSEETACDQLAPTPFMTLVYGQISIDEQPAPPGTVVDVVTPRGGVAGCFVVEQAGQFGLMHVFGEDSTANPPIDGFRAGETLQFRLNGVPVQAVTSIQWQDDRTPHFNTLLATPVNLFLPFLSKQP